MVKDDQLYLGIGKHKDAYAQLVANPNVYICGCKPSGSEWIRIAGRAVCDEDPALVEAVFEHAPDLRGLYESNGWEMGVFHLEDAKAIWVENVMAPVRTETF